MQEPDPCSFYLPTLNYLNLAHVQQALGAGLNFTESSTLEEATTGFSTTLGTGDGVRQAGLPNLEYLLANGVKIALVYGDRDYRCPWTGAEATAKAANWTSQKGFLSAGYEKILGISSGDQGVVKQYGPLSFSRIFNSGHAANAYAPEAVYRIFERATFGKDVATGNETVSAEYSTTGPTDSWGWRNTLPATLPGTCMVEGRWTKTNPWASILGTQSLEGDR